MISAEDVHFFTDDEGINFLSTLRSLYNDIFQKQQGIQGASTITQQLVKNIFLSDNRSVQNKIEQILLSIRISQVYSKKQILDAYLNDIYFGDGSYGIYSASERYFGIPPSKLNLAQSSMLAGIVQAPSVYSPISGTNPKLGRIRQIYVLNQMIKHNDIINIPISEIKSAKLEKLRYNLN
jgi:penicillin-binding protein 1A